jgi:hypothetical protein
LRWLLFSSEETFVLRENGVLVKIGTLARYVKARLCQTGFCDRFAANVGAISLTAFKSRHEPRKQPR